MTQPEGGDKGLSSLTEAQLKQTNVWGLFGWGASKKSATVRAMPFLAHMEKLDPALSFSDNAVPDGWRGKYKRHILDPAPELMFGEDTPANRLLLLEGPVPQDDKEKPLPIYFGPTLIYGPFIIVWHDSRTDTDIFIHCPSCLSNVATYVNGMQDTWEKEYSTMTHEGVVHVAPSATIN